MFPDAQSGDAPTMAGHGGSPVTSASSPADKIALFRSLFRGREDVYPQRFESRRTGRAGYSPACANEWVRGICEKPKIKCAECPHRRFLPVTDGVIRQHLSGRDELGRDFVMGIYPMLLDETCLFLAVDFDRESWQADAGAFVETCRQLGTHRHRLPGERLFAHARSSAFVLRVARFEIHHRTLDGFLERSLRQNPSGHWNN